VQTKHKIELTFANHFPRDPFAFCKVAFASIPLEVLLTKEEELRALAYEKNSDLAGIIHSLPRITAKRFYHPTNQTQ
jgi:hypothetical protein